MHVESAVLERYTEGANERQEALCCPVDYDASLLALLPTEIIEKDYGCGDPSRYVQAGDVVLDLGSGSGKICYMAAQLVGEKGRVIGVDMNDDMLALARKYQPEMAEKLGADRVQFCKGQIQDLARDLEAEINWLSANPVTDGDSLRALEHWQQQQRKQQPLIADNSVDLIISNCVLNLVGDEQKQQLVDEIFRVLKPGGRIAISDIISDEAIPQHLKDDEQLWSGCISGAFQEEEMLQTFKAVGFVGAAYDKWADEPWQVVEGIEFRSVTLTAMKPVHGRREDYGHTVIYRGPFSAVTDDAGRVYPRGVRIGTSENAYRLLVEGPYADNFIGIAPAQNAEAIACCIAAGTRRDAKLNKGAVHSGSGEASCC
jgi:ubiquinone/menaquinone biosynthesis C-methylase UbiE